MVRLGLALGGGGVAGGSHIGVIRALEEEGIPISSLSGTSAGAMVAALYAYGVDGKQLADTIPGVTKKLLDYDYWSFLRRVFDKQVPIAGLIKGEKLQELLIRELKDADLTQARLPLFVTATDLGAARQVVFASRRIQLPQGYGPAEILYEGKAAEAVYASMAIPGLFRPVYLGDRVLVDGGLMDNCPTSALRAAGADAVLAVNLISAKPGHKAYRSMGAVLMRAMSVGLNRLSQTDQGHADIVLIPGLESVSILDFTSLSLCMEQGYEYARKRMADINRMLEQADKQGG